MHPAFLQSTATRSGPRVRSSLRAFTLIEVLVVISIIAVLAALVTSLAGNVAEKRKRAIVEMELNQFLTVIEHYKEKVGSYPPDNPVSVAAPPLFYELAGTRPTTNNSYVTLSGNIRITAASIAASFGLPGFANAVPGEAKNYFPNIRPGQHREVKNSLNESVEFMVVPVDGPNQVLAADGRPVNLWRYNSSHPTNSAGSFDLWAEVTIRGKTEIIGNWNRK